MTGAFLSGFLIVDKPSGVTSFSMVSLVRRLTGIRRVGHAGTLDPLATGVLPVAVGQATRFIEYMDDAPKVYEATVRFGIETNTYDAEGEITTTADPSGVTREAIEALLPRFIGDIEQIPPAHSAIKLAGKPLYRYAREGIAVEPQPRCVHIDRIQLRSFEPGAAAAIDIEVTCGKGTYIRSLAHDIGGALGCGGHLTALRRTSSGGFNIRLARTPDELVALAERDQLTPAMLAVDRAVERRPAAILAALHTLDVSAGRSFPLDPPRIAKASKSDEICRAYDASGSFLGILRAEADGTWHPAKVLPRA
jgi:tRNA pseudouridine55 synthase